MLFVRQCVTMDIVIDELIIEEDRPAHIAKHNVSMDEVLEKEKLLYQEKFRGDQK